VSTFGALGISGSGIEAAQVWIDTLAGNVANANDAVPANRPAYAAQTPVVAPVPPGPAGVGDGVAVVGVALGTSQGPLAYEPGDPVADAAGYVRYPAVDLGSQLADLVVAQTAYQANVAALERAKAAYQAALTIGS
jgi:flagellar basal-body rod protein FlgC